MKHPASICSAVLRRIGQQLPDKFYLRLLFYLEKGEKLDLITPISFCEKLQWLKLYDRRPEYVKMVDKYAVKDYVSEIIGERFVIPTIGIWERPEDIEWDKLPERFVLKTTHGGGNTGVVICRDKLSFDTKAAVKKLKKSLRQDIYRSLREWPYKNVPRRIIAEQYIEPEGEAKDLPDYKWFCFNGEPRFCQVIQNRSSKETIVFFDTEWNRQEFIGLNPIAVPPEVLPKKPANLDAHLSIARQLSKNIPFARIDLFETGNRTYFGEITFYPKSGFGAFTPKKYNEILGEMIVLPSEKVK